MDYEKKYKEAQKWIESIYSELSHEQQMEAEAFFPELKESEDEMIRKTLIRFFKDNYPNETEMYDGTVTVGKALAWLEKQGNPTDKDMQEALRTEYEKGRADAFKRAAESFCKATCNGNPPRSTCTSLGTCKEYGNFIKFMKE